MFFVQCRHTKILRNAVAAIKKSLNSISLNTGNAIKCVISNDRHGQGDQRGFPLNEKKIRINNALLFRFLGSR